MTTAEKLENFPPILVRLLARHGGRPLTIEQIVSGYGRATPERRAYFERLSWQTDWQGVPVLDAMAFLRGCGLDIDSTAAWQRLKYYLHAGPTFRYLRASPDWRTIYEPMLVKWRMAYPPEPPTHLCKHIKNLLRRLAPLLISSPVSSAAQRPTTGSSSLKRN